MPLRLHKHKRGPGFWKLNCTLLEDPKYKEIITVCICECLQDNKGTEDGLMWETLKCMIRGVSIKYSEAKKKNKNDKILHLETELEILKSDTVTSDKPDILNNRIKDDASCQWCPCNNQALLHPLPTQEPLTANLACRSFATVNYFHNLIPKFRKFIT